MGERLEEIWKLIKAAAGGVVEDKVPRLGAALSYYTIFAIPPLFVIAIFIASLVFNPADVRTEMFSEVGGLIGKKSAEAIESAMAVQYQSNKGALASVIAMVTLLATSTGLFIELQDALNTIWRVEARPGHGVLGFVRMRLLSFAMVVGIGFLLLVSLVISAALAALSKYISVRLPGLGVVWVVVNDIVAFGVITFLFAMIFKVLPDVKIPWRSVWIGAVVTSLLFTVGKFLLGWYLGRSSTVSAYGAAGSIVLVLLWVYYSSQILFFGAELTKACARRQGEAVQPEHYAAWISPEKKARFTKRTPAIDFDRKSELVAQIKEEIASLRDVVHHREG